MEDRKNQLSAETDQLNAETLNRTMAGAAEAPAAAPETDAPPAGDGDGALARDGADLGTSSAIGRRLKAYYDDVASEPVPDRFLMLLEALDKAEAEPARAVAPPQTGRR